MVVSAHSLSSWAKRYSTDKANKTYSFAFHNVPHIDGNNLNYFWTDINDQAQFNLAFTFAFYAGWNNIITSTLTTRENAHVKLDVIRTDHPDDIIAETIIHGVALLKPHIRPGKDDAEINFYKPFIEAEFYQLTFAAAHEIGHLWGLDDIYNTRTDLESIYSDISNKLSDPSRHDKNGLRIGLNNLWYEPVSGAWWYQPKPDEWHLRGDVVGNDDKITAADARQILRFSAHLDTPTQLQRILSDVDGNGKLTAADARYVEQYSAKLINNFPADHD